MIVTPVQDDDISIGDDSSVLLRPLRQLLDNGKPPGPLTPLVFKLDGQPTRPLGALFTGKSRISFWPAYPNVTDMTKELDHVTLELPSGKSHMTGRRANGKPYRIGKKQGWRLQSFAGSAYAWWFPMLIRWGTIINQDTVIRRKISWPSENERTRRLRELREYSERLAQPFPIPLHSNQIVAPNYVLFHAYVANNLTAPDVFLPDMFPSNYAMDKVKGWEADGGFHTQLVKASLGGHKFMFGAACPSGELESAVWFGLPRMKSNQGRKLAGIGI
jgi:hypothetical protein